MGTHSLEQGQYLWTAPLRYVLLYSQYVPHVGADLVDIAAGNGAAQKLLIELFTQNAVMRLDKTMFIKKIIIAMSMESSIGFNVNDVEPYQ